MARSAASSVTEMKPELPTDPRRQMFSLVIIMLAIFSLGVSLGMMAVVFPTSMEALGFSRSLIGTVMSMETLASVLVCFMMVSLFRYIGLRLGLVFSTLLRLPPLVALAYFQDLNFWVVMALMHGLGSGIFFLQLQTWLNSIPFQTSRGFKIALFGTSISLGLSLGPVVLQFIDAMQPLIAQIANLCRLEITDYALQAPFFAIAFVSFLALIPVLLGFFVMPSLKSAKRMALLPLINESKGVLYGLAFGGASLFGVSSFITLYGMQNGLTLTDASLLLTSFMLGGLLLEAPIAWISDHFDRRYVIIAAVLLSLVCSVYLPIAIYRSYQAWILLFLWGGVVGAIYSISLTILGEKYPAEELVSVNAAYSVMENSGGVVGAVLIGLSMDLFGSDGLPYVILFTGLCYFTFALTRYKVE
ncbi:MAG: MFS transporter [Pseudomonadales bacterium]|nr:MFS transporter [Pseudomonadales bacterium]